MPEHRIDTEVHGQHQRFELTAEQATEPISRVLRSRELALNTRCGGKGLCDGCMVELTEGKLTHAPSGNTVEAEGQPIMLRGCEHRADQGPVAIRIPGRSLLAHAPQVVSNFKIRVPWAYNPLWQGQRPEADPPIGIAVDVGTTTVALMLVDLKTGRVLARTSAFNKQMRYGDDVLTRINLCSTEPDMLGKLQRAVAKHTIAPLVSEALQRIEADASQVVCYAVAANSTMLHLLAGVDPTPMGVAPFTAPFLEHQVHAAESLGLPGDAEVHLLPGAAAYVGADLVAGCLATGQAYSDQTTLLVDVGTNGEIILHHAGHLTGCATAAGPAFEGARLASGMRAADGAIERVDFGGDPVEPIVKAIGDVEPTGICGSGYLDLLAAGRRAGLLSPAGRFATEHDRITAGQHGKALQLAGDNGNAVTVTESDIASLLQAKGAIGAGIVTLLGRLGLTTDDVSHVHLAGGFGMHIDVANAVACGLLPGFDPQTIEAVGNTSLAGAYLALLDRGVLDELKRIASQVELIELNLEPEFEMNFIEHLSLP